MNGNRQKNKRTDSKVESTESPDIPDKGETSDTPGLPSGCKNEENNVFLTIVITRKYHWSLHVVKTDWTLQEFFKILKNASRSR